MGTTYHHRLILSCPRPDPSSTDEFEKWLDRQSIFKKCYDTVADLVVKNTSIVACTNNLAGSHIVRRNFGANGKPIIVIADEDGQALEPDVIIPLVSLDMAQLVVGTIRGGDSHQLPPLAITASEVPGYNEFGSQLARSFFDRLRRARFPVTTVSQQCRMCPQLRKFPSEFTYFGRMTDDPSVASIIINSELADALLTWIRTKEPGAKFNNGLELIGLNVSNGQTMVNDRNHSRSNAENVSVVMDLVEFLINQNVLSNVTCSIITTYSEQKKCYITKMLELSEKLNIIRQDMVEVVSVDRMQGHEKDMIILDWVVDSGTKSDLGFASDNRRANVAITRARTCLIVVANGRIIDNDRLSEVKPMEVPPEILVHWQYLLNNRLIVDCPAELPTVDNNDRDENECPGPAELPTVDGNDQEKESPYPVGPPDW
ncbi:AAA domain-containing protein [Aspergillus novoparasiticus]|uniref:AAA domain-containing protein n=1 Tax=Aspergillus novoparasiticus TaxID=986946 RepID=A0A5N6F9J3_9EURO|nr:AAA domain-containing protein [Aspergillus novoparasiticus]